MVTSTRANALCLFIRLAIVFILKRLRQVLNKNRIFFTKIFINIAAIKRIFQLKNSTKVPIIIVGNMIDLQDRREVLKEEGEALAAKYNVLFIETSAKDRINVDEVFEAIVNRVLDIRLGKVENCVQSVITFLAIRRFSKKWSSIPNDVWLLIAKQIYKTRSENCWRRKHVLRNKEN